MRTHDDITPSLFGAAPPTEVERLRAAAAPKTTFTLRPYQQEAHDCVLRDFESSSSTLCVMPTGCGKTVLFGAVARSMRQQGRILVIAHRKELIEQAARTMHLMTGERVDIEMADQWADQAYRTKAPIVVSSVQTQIAGGGGAGRMARFDPKEFGLVVIDEAHHAPANSYRKMLKHYHAGNPALKLMGVTATPDRKDEAALGEIFDTVAYDYEISDAIRDGWLVPIEQNMVHVHGLDFSACRTTAGDLNQGDLAAIMEQEAMLHSVASPVMEIADGRKVLVFVASVRHAELICEIFNRHELGSAGWVHGGTPTWERESLFRRYRDGDVRILCNVGVATEGFDEPTIEVVAVARPTKSRSLYAQMVGRGTRPLPGVVDGPETAEARHAAIADSAKAKVEVLDFVGNCGRHKLMTTADILGGKELPEVVERARKLLTEGQEKNTAKAIERSREEIEEEKAKEAKRRSHIIGSAHWSKSTVSSFDLFDVEVPVERGWDRGKQLTAKQVAYLERQKVNVKDLSYTQARALLDKLFGRMQHGWCSLAQAKVLKRAGYSKAELKAMRFEEASKLIEACKRNNWKRPKGGE
jgi:superfamily II DNA or RNA helicase